MEEEYPVRPENGNNLNLDHILHKISEVLGCLNYRIQRIQVVLNSCHHGSSVGFYFAVEQGREE